MGTYDGIGVNYSTLMNDPYFLAALNGYNLNFKSSQAYQSYPTTEAAGVQNTAASSALPVAAQSEQESSGGMNFATGALATTVIGLGACAFLKKNPGAMSKVKSFLHIGNGSSDSVNTALKKLTAVKDADGKIRFLIPGETTTLTGSSINNFVTKHGIQSSVSAERQAFNPETSKLNTFVFNSGADQYVIKSENGVITGIKDKSGDEILKRMQDAESGHADAVRLASIEQILKELGKTKDVDKTVLNGVSDIRYTNTYGDDVLKLSLNKYGETPQLNEFTTLQRFDFNDNKVQALTLSSKEEAFANSTFYKDGKLVEGVKVSRFSDNIGGGNIGNFEGETLVSITKPDGTVLPVGSAGYTDAVNKYQSNIDKLVEKVFEKRNYIPKGAIIVGQ